MATRHYVSPDLSIITHIDDGLPYLDIQSQQSPTAGLVGVDPTELPALLAVLTKAAVEMGVSTVQAELVATMERLLACWEVRVTPEELQAQFVENDEAMKQARETLAKAKQ